MLLNLPDGAAPKTVLYVEDSPANLALVAQLISRRVDLKMLAAINGCSGILLAKEARPDVIILDINLPDIHGYEMLKILLGNPATSHIPVIALSSDAYPRQIEKGIKAGFFLYMTKPFKIDEFMDAIDTALNHAATSQEKQLLT
jgi:CheY-like chemotaxis protein